MDYAQLQTLGDLARRPELAIVEIVTQDEYTHDVVTRAPTHFIVFDAT